MNKADAARNRLVTALSLAIAEAAGHPGQLQQEDQKHAIDIAAEVEAMIKLYADGDPGTEITL